MNAYLHPENLEDALASLGERPYRILAGDTDVYPADAAAVGWGKPGIDHPDGLPSPERGVGDGRMRTHAGGRSRIRANHSSCCAGDNLAKFGNAPSR